MAKQKRQKKSTAKNQAQTFEDAEKTHECPISLSLVEKKTFDMVVASREWDTWTDLDLLTAGKMAKISIEMDRLMEELDDQGVTDVGPNGNTVVSPLFTVWSKLADKYVLLQRTLGLSAAQKGVSGKTQHGRNQQQAQAKRKLASVSPLLS